MTRDKRNQAKISAIIAILVEEGVISAEEASEIDNIQEYSNVHRQAQDARNNGKRPEFASTPGGNKDGGGEEDEGNNR